MTVKFIHIRSGVLGIEPCGGTTVAYEYNPDTHQVKYALAVCNPKEHYCKRVGRMVAGGRLRKAPVGEFTALENRPLTPQIMHQMVKAELGGALRVGEVGTMLGVVYHD